MADKAQTQIDLEKETLFLELDTFIANLRGKSYHCYKEIVAAKSLKTEIEALLVKLSDLHRSDSSRNNPYQEVTTKIAEARQWLNQKNDEFKKEEDTKNVAPANFIQHLLSDSEGMDTDHHKSSLQVGLELQMNPALGISAAAFLGSLNRSPEEIKRVKADLYKGLDKSREYSVIVKETLSVLEKFFPSTSTSNSNDIDESDNEEDNSTESDHSGDEGKGAAMPSKKRANRDTDEPRKRQKLVPGEVMVSTESSIISSNNFSELNKSTNPEVESLIPRVTRGIKYLEGQSKHVGELKGAIDNDKEKGKSIRELLSTGRRKLEEETNIRYAKQWLKDVDVDSEEESQSLTSTKKFLVLVMADPLAQSLYIRLFNRLGKQENIAMEFRVAETFEESVQCLCHYGDSFNLILVDMEMRRSNCSKVIMELRFNGIRGNIVGVTSANESEQKAFVEAGLTYVLKSHCRHLTRLHLSSCVLRKRISLVFKGALSNK